MADSTAVTMVIRAAGPADMAALRDVYRRSSLHNPGDRESLLAHPEVLELSDAGVMEQRTRVAVRDDRIVGFATVEEVEDRFELEDLFVDPDWMSRGIGRQLVLDVISLARERGIERIEVTGNGHALDFYEEVGFIVDGPTATPLGEGLRMHLDVAAV